MPARPLQGVHKMEHPAIWLHSNFTLRLEGAVQSCTAGVPMINLIHKLKMARQKRSLLTRTAPEGIGGRVEDRRWCEHASIYREGITPTGKNMPAKSPFINPSVSPRFRHPQKKDGKWPRCRPLTTASLYGARKTGGVENGSSVQPVDHWPEGDSVGAQKIPRQLEFGLLKAHHGRKALSTRGKPPLWSKGFW